MELFRTVVDGNAVSKLFPLPEPYQDREVEIVITPVQKRDKGEKLAAFNKLLRLKKPMPVDFDYKKELVEARDVKYGIVD
ncbi:hypothetical protein RsTz2092_03140 [Deferribacterales bacterium RsTz2092]|nr:hypothetical protein AGMMS49941_12460 [Deferribacterales bacterium]